MSTSDLFELLPTVYRLRDADRGGPLQALVDLVATQVGELKGDLDGLWDDLFVETCAEWVVPYIGDLVANTPLYEVPGVGRRADVARTIYWRRRKGTLAMLGDLARHVTGWGATAVAMFELLEWNQNLNHIRLLAGADDPGGIHPLALDRVGTVDLRDRDCVDRVDTAWDQIVHTVDLRKITDDQGWYGIRKVCFFVFRLRSFPMAGMTLAASASGGAGCFHVHPLGQDAPVFHLGVPVAQSQSPVGRQAPAEPQAFADETNVDAPIRPYRFYLRPELDWGQTLVVHNGPNVVPVSDVICKDLSSWPAVPDDKVGVDVRTGRIRFGAKYALDPALTVDACYGFSAATGGGPYSRDSATAAAAGAALELAVPSAFADLAAAYAHWLTLPAQDVRFVVEDSATYALPAGGLDVTRPGLPKPVSITIAAADQQRPLLTGGINVHDISLHLFALDGLLLSGSLSVAGPVQEVSVSDCTLVPGISLGEDGIPQQPGAASLTADQPSDRRDVTLTRCIAGPLRLPADGNHLQVLDSIIDAPPGAPTQVALAADDAGTVSGPECDLQRVTVRGAVFVRELTLASECIFVDGTLRAVRRQAGCVRFSSLQRQGAHTPRRYRCQPDLVRRAAPDPATAHREELRVRPSFTTSAYGQPGYFQLGRGCAQEITQGAEDGAEMGAFHLLLQPYREANLRVRLDEYLPFGLEPGIVHVT
ncbi:MAG TPA: hypothetical protein VGH24_06185 [Solirubrobacteraceae bacterium]|jgi:hypothetical protein